MTKGNKLQTLTIGIPVYNEEQSLPCSFTSLAEAINQLPRNVNVEVIYCLNGCTDDSGKILRDLAENGPRIERLEIMTSEPGKMNAQLAILGKRTFNDGMICFADADIVMEPQTLVALMGKLQQDQNCQAAYAHVEPHVPNHPSLFQDLLLAHYISRVKQPPRNYIHGRTFMMRDGSLLETMRDDLPQRVERVRNEENPWFMGHLGLEEGPKVDDIYLSRVIAHKYGPNAISQVQGATIHFHPPESLEDYIGVMDRTLTEIRRLDLLYPEHRYLQETVFRRDFDNANNPTLPADTRRQLGLLIEIERVHCNLIKDSLTPPDMRVNELGSKPWVSAPTTKKSFGDPSDPNFLTSITNGALPGKDAKPAQIVVGSGPTGIKADEIMDGDTDPLQEDHINLAQKPPEPPREPGGMH